MPMGGHLAFPGDAVDAGASRRALAWRWPVVTAEQMAPLGLFIVWALCNPYFETGSSTLIYTLRAVADLDPAGVGRDFMFRFDGQSKFTLFTGLFHALAAAVGPAQATFIVAAASLLAGFAGAMALAASICGGRTRVLAVVFAAALPAFYGGFKIFSYAETAATPRPFTEALVLCGIAAVIRGRTTLAALAMVVAALLHPIMALPGIVVLYVFLLAADRRWLVAIPIGAGLLLAAVGFGVAPFDRLGAVLDPAWRAVLVERSPHLFPTLWPHGWIGRAAARVATLLIAASLSPAPVRKLFLVATAIGLAGLAFAFLAERLPLAIFLQAQTWRAMWLVFSLATAAAAICVVELWQRGGLARVILALLALSWVYADHDQAGVLLACAALGLIFVVDAEAIDISPRLITIVLVVFGLLLVVGVLASELSIAGAIGDVSAAQDGEARSTLALDWDYTPLAIVAAIGVAMARIRLNRTAMSALILIGFVALAFAWDRRSLETRYFDAGTGAPDLARIIDARKGEVFWIGGGRESWSWLGRPQWLSAIQGAGIVFSRELAMRYQDRADRAVAAGLEDRAALMPLSPTAPDIADTNRFAGIVAFCAAEDAPAWIIAPLQDGEPLPAGLDARAWSAPIARLTPIAERGALSWRTLVRYAIIPCRA